MTAYPYHVWTCTYKDGHTLTVTANTWQEALAKAQAVTSKTENPLSMLALLSA